MKIIQRIAATSLVFAFAATAVFAGPIDPECTAEKAAKGAVAKSTVGVGGRCSPAEAAKDTGKKAVGIDDKGPLEKQGHKNDTPVEKAVNKGKDAVAK